MSLITEVHDKINEGVTAVEGWIGEVKDRLPALVDLATKYEQSPIVQALEGAVLPANVEEEIARLITAAHNAFAEHGSATVTGTAGPAAPTADQPAPEPVESDSAPAAAETATPTV